MPVPIRQIALFVYCCICFFAPLVVIVTATGKTTEVSCDFSKEYACGYTVGECWELTTASVFDSSGNKRSVPLSVDFIAVSVINFCKFTAMSSDRHFLS